VVDLDGHPEFALVLDHIRGADFIAVDLHVVKNPETLIWSGIPACIAGVGLLPQIVCVFKWRARQPGD
jgi:hypothetical protein